MSMWIGIGFTVVVTLILISLYKVPTTFNVSATTQALNIIIGSSHRSMWGFRNAMVFFGYDVQGRIFTGRVLVLPHTIVSFERVGSGPLRLRCQSRSPGVAVAKLYDAEGTAPLLVKDRLVLVDRAPERYSAEGHEIVLPMSGLISIGAEIGDTISDRPNLLLGGEVTLLAQTLIGERRYDAGRVLLDMGDFIAVRQHGDAYGLLVVREKPELSAIFRVIGKSIRVYRFGTKGYDVYASPLTRIQNDYVLQAIWGVSLFVITMIAKLVKKESGRIDK